MNQLQTYYRIEMHTWAGDLVACVDRVPKDHVLTALRTIAAFAPFEQNRRRPPFEEVMLTESEFTAWLDGNEGRQPLVDSFLLWSDVHVIYLGEHPELLGV